MTTYRTAATYRTARLTAAALAIPLLLSALTACGTNADASDPDQGADGAGGSTESSRSFDDYQLDFASCMREQGIDMPDPNEDGSVEAQKMTDGMMEATEVCQEELGDPPAAPGGGPEKTDEEQRAEWLEIAACFRENGIDVPDPGPGESITLPMDASGEIFEKCAPEGIGGAASAGGN